MDFGSNLLQTFSISETKFDIIRIFPLANIRFFHILPYPPETYSLESRRHGGLWWT